MNLKSSMGNGTSNKIVVAMSGGVDSSAAALLLKEAGHEVVGVTLKLRECGEQRSGRSCCGTDGILRAGAVAGHLGIPHYILNCADIFNNQILRPAWEEYSRGRTPSPCLPCNEKMKFGLLLEWSRKLGASHIATGHYARIVTSASDENLLLLRGSDRHKDQSYFLAGLTAEQLKYILFPLGNLSKRQVRLILASHGLKRASQASESNDACLIEKGQHFSEMLRQRFKAENMPGIIADECGRILGNHSGIHHFTIGQRRGLSIGTGKRCWVKDICHETATITVTTVQGDLLSRIFTVSGVSWVDGEMPAYPIICSVQVRYRQTAVDSIITPMEDGCLRVSCVAAINSVTPGQAAVFYDRERVLGRGWILDAA